MSKAPSLVRAAFFEPLHLVALVVGLLLSVLVLNLPMWAELGALAVLEGLYLSLVPRMPAYARKASLAAAVEQRAVQDALMEEKATALRKDDRRRYNSLNKLYQEVRTLLEEAGSSSGIGFGEELSRIGELRDAALEFSLASQRFRDHLAKNAPAELELELRQPPLNDAERTRQELIRQRLTGLQQMEHELRHLESQLGVIEQTLRLLKEQTASLKTGSYKLPESVTSLSTEIEATRRTVRELAALERL